MDIIMRHHWTAWAKKKMTLNNAWMHNYAVSIAKIAELKTNWCRIQKYSTYLASATSTSIEIIAETNAYFERFQNYFLDKLKKLEKYLAKGSCWNEKMVKNTHESRQNNVF